MKMVESSLISVEQKIENIIARQVSLQHEFEEAKRQLEAFHEQEQETSLRSLEPGDTVHIFYVPDIPKRAQEKIIRPVKEAVVVAHGERLCRVSVHGIEFNIRYASLLLPGGVIPAARANAICRSIEATLKKRRRPKSR